jgi:arginine:pyruvate transaminase
MKLANLVDRISGEGAEAWEIHYLGRQARDRGEDAIVLSVGDPDFATPQPIIDSAVSALQRGDTHYSAIAGKQPLREAIARDFSARCGLACDPSQVHVFGGTQNALFAASLCLLEKGDEVIALEPMYISYEATLGIGGATLIRVAQPAEQDFRPQAALIATAITPATRAIVVTTPNNPTGVVMTADELQAIADLAIAHDLWVIADEVYTDLIFEGEHHSIAALPGMAERTITINSLSKSHAMTGWRVGWAISPSLLEPHFNNLSLCMLYGLAGFIQEAAITALTEQREASAAMRDIYLARRELVCDALAAADRLNVLKPQAGMYVMADVRAYGMTSDEFSRALWAEQMVSVLDGRAFGHSADGWVRISFTLSEQELREGCRRIVEFLAKR